MSAAFRWSSLAWALGLALLAGSAAGTAWLLHTAGPGPETSQHDDRDNEAEAAVCEGHVDTGGGVVDLRPVSPGRVTEVRVREDQAVRAGAVLLRVDDALARLRCDEAAAALAGAKTQLALAGTLQGQYDRKLEEQRAAIRAAREGLQVAEQEYQRQQQLMRKGLANTEVVAGARARVKQLQALAEVEAAKLGELESHAHDPELGVARSRADVDLARARLEQARQAVEDCTLRAPRNGRVLRLQVDVGDTLAAQALKPAVLFCPDEEVIVRAEVAQEFAGRVRQGQAALIRDDTGLHPAEWRGQVARVSGWFARQRSVLLEPGQLNDVRTLECIIRLRAEDGKGPPGLRIGQRVRVRILNAQGP